MVVPVVVVVMDDVVILEWMELLDFARGDEVCFVWVVEMASSNAALVLGVDATRLRNCCWMTKEKDEKGSARLHLRMWTGDQGGAQSGH